MNPTFRRIDFDGCGPEIMRYDRLTVKVWVKRAQGKWRQLMEMDLQMAGLQYLAKDVRPRDCRYCA